jgi:hypothetical protein
MANLVENLNRESQKISMRSRTNFFSRIITFDIFPLKKGVKLFDVIFSVCIF